MAARHSLLASSLLAHSSSLACQLLRPFTADDFRPGVPLVFVLGHRTWVNRLGGDPNVSNKTFVLDGEPYTPVASGEIYAPWRFHVMDIECGVGVDKSRALR